MVNTKLGDSSIVCVLSITQYNPDLGLTKLQGLPKARLQEIEASRISLNLVQ